MTKSQKSCGTQHLEEKLPTDTWAVDRLGDFAASQHLSITRDEETLAPKYWRLGLSLNLARKQIPHGEWLRFLKSFSIDRTRASKARAIHRTFTNEDDLDGLTVEEAYSQRERRGTAGESGDKSSFEKMNSYLEQLGDCAQEVAGEISWIDSAALCDLGRNIDTAIEVLAMLRKQLDSQPAAQASA